MDIEPVFGEWIVCKTPPTPRTVAGIELPQTAYDKHAGRSMGEVVAIGPDVLMNRADIDVGKIIVFVLDPMSGGPSVRSIAGLDGRVLRLVKASEVVGIVARDPHMTSDEFRRIQNMEDARVREMQDRARAASLVVAAGEVR